jgi:CDP-paratose 2-epimerase
MHVVITGICGFVGSSIAIQLLERFSDIKVSGIDNFVRPGSERNRIILTKRGVSVLHGDVRVLGDVLRLPTADLVIDAAANASVLAGTAGDDARDLFDTNLVGTLNILDYCRRTKAGLILLSTSRVYSQKALEAIPLTSLDTRYALDTSCPLPVGVTLHGISEKFSTNPPISLYGASKLASETITFEYGAAFDFPVWINRCGVLTGGGQFGVASQGIFAYWINRYLRRQPLKYTGFDGNGFQVRDIMHPSDLVNLMLLQLADPTSAGRIWNVGGGPTNSLSLCELSSWCLERFGYHPIATDPGFRPYDVPYLVLDSRSACESLGWKPELNSRTILMDIADHAEAHEDWLEISAATK